MTFIEGDRVRIAGTESAIGTVTKDRSTGGFEHFIGILWDTGAFGFANPNKVEHVETIPGMTERERMALGEAYRSALHAVDPIGFVTSQNRTETGTDVAPDEDFTRDLANGMKHAYDVACYNDGHNIYAWTAAAHYVIERFRLDQ